MGVYMRAPDFWKLLTGLFEGDTGPIRDVLDYIGSILGLNVES